MATTNIAWLWHCLQEYSPWILTWSTLRYVLVVLLAGTIILHHVRKRRRIVALIDQLPGPPVYPWFPWMGHAQLVLEIDRMKYEHGTYSCKLP